MAMDVRAYNRAAWNRQVEQGNNWTRPVSPEQIARARSGDWEIVLTPIKAVPRPWFGDLAGARVLCLASGGGQQGPILAAAGAIVTVLDNSPAQLAQDRMVAEREGLTIECIEGDMAAPDALADASFDLIVHPVSNCFVPDVRPVWRAAHRLLRPGGALLAGFCNPVLYLFDEEASKRGELVARHPIPYSDLVSLSAEERDARLRAGEPLSFGHTLEDQIGGQLDAGLVLVGFYEDTWRADDNEPIARLLPSFIATRAVRPPTAPTSSATARTLRP